MPAQGGSGTVITGNPAQAGTFNFTIKATDGSLTSTLAYQITITVQGPPDQLLCDSAGDFLESGVCVLPDAIAGLPYAGQLSTSHNVGGTLRIVAGALPAGQAEPLVLGVDREDADRDAGACRPGLLMRETGEAFGFDERAERHLLGHHAFDDVTDLVTREEYLPAHEDHLLPVTSGGARFSRRGRASRPRGDQAVAG